MTIPPKGSASVTVTMERRGRNSGQEESVLVKTDDGKEVRLVMRSPIPDLLAIRPVFVWWKQGEARTPKELIVEVKDTKAGVKKLTVTADTEHFTAEVVTEAEGARYRLRLKPKDTAPSGITTFTLKVDAPPAHPATILGYAKIL